jgi:hypothetical protein
LSFFFCLFEFFFCLVTSLVIIISHRVAVRLRRRTRRSCASPQTQPPCFHPAIDLCGSGRSSLCRVPSTNYSFRSLFLRYTHTDATVLSRDDVCNGALVLTPDAQRTLDTIMPWLENHESFVLVGPEGELFHRLVHTPPTTTTTTDDHSPPTTTTTTDDHAPPSVHCLQLQHSPHTTHCHHNHSRPLTTHHHQCTASSSSTHYTPHTATTTRVRQADDLEARVLSCQRRCGDGALQRSNVAVRCPGQDRTVLCRLQLKRWSRVPPQDGRFTHSVRF